jgi:hypothetical protein
MEIKLVISQKIVDDNYIDAWAWQVIQVLDENKNILAKGEEKTLFDCYEPGRKALKKYQNKLGNTL